MFGEPYERALIFLYLRQICQILRQEDTVVIGISHLNFVIKLFKSSNEEQIEIKGMAELPEQYE